MRDFRRLPPLLRVVYGLGLLVIIAGLILFIVLIVSHMVFIAMVFIAMNLTMLGQACFIVVYTYTHSPDSRLFPLHSWRSQAIAIALLAALPLCAIILTASIPSAKDTAQVVGIISLIEAVGLCLAFLASAIDRPQVR